MAILISFRIEKQISESIPCLVQSHQHDVYYLHQERVRFHNTGSSWVPGVLVMSIEDGHEGVPGLSQLDPM